MRPRRFCATRAQVPRDAACTGDMGFSAAKTYDLEVWMPGQNSFVGNFVLLKLRGLPGRRADIRFKTAGSKGTRLVHTLNGSDSPSAAPSPPSWKTTSNPTAPSAFPTLSSLHGLRPDQKVDIFQE